MQWQDHITSDPTVLAGKPVVRGTRISIEFLLKLLASGWTREQMLREYPHLSAKTGEAVLLSAASSKGSPTS